MYIHVPLWINAKLAIYFSSRCLCSIMFVYFDKVFNNSPEMKLCNCGSYAWNQLAINNWDYLSNAAVPLIISKFTVRDTKYEFDPYPVRWLVYWPQTPTRELQWFFATLSSLNDFFLISWNNYTILPHRVSEQFSLKKSLHGVMPMALQLPSEWPVKKVAFLRSVVVMCR